MVMSEAEAREMVEWMVEESAVPARARAMVGERASAVTCSTEVRLSATGGVQLTVWVRLGKAEGVSTQGVPLPVPGGRVITKDTLSGVIRTVDAALGDLAKSLGVAA